MSSKTKKILTSKSLRLSVQGFSTLLSAWIGWEFFKYLQWATGAAAEHTARPAGIEAWLPISAYMGLRNLLSTGNWDTVHPAGLTILVMALLMAVLLRKSFCSHMCPIGLISNLFEKAGRRYRLAITIHPMLARILGSIKYIMLGFFTFTIWGMPQEQLQAFLNSQYNMTADAKLLKFFMSPSSTALIVIAMLILLSLLIRNFWCRFLCPYGALLGLASLLSPLGLHRDPKKCVDCGKCDTVCPSGINITKTTRVNNALCTGCMECAASCPVQDCLTPRYFGRAKLSLLFAGAATLILFALVYLWAVSTGHWESQLPQDMLKMLYAKALAS